MEDIVLRNIDISFPGGGSATGQAVAEDTKRYPEQFFFGVLPSWGLFIRHAQDVRLENVRLTLRAADARPACFEEDVTGVSKVNCDFRTFGQ